MKVLEENMGECVYDFGVGKRKYITKINKLYNIKI